MEEDPRLARMLSTGRPSEITDAVVVLASMLASFAGGLLLLVLGTQFTSPVLPAIGVLLVVVVPAVLAVWRFRRYRAHRS